MNQITIKHLMTVYEAIIQAMSQMDRVDMLDCGQSWAALNEARNIIRVVIENTGATVAIKGEE